MADEKRIQCGSHGPLTWRGTVVCQSCGEPYRFMPARSGKLGMNDLIDRDGSIREKKGCAKCNASFPAALMPICGVCHAARVAAGAVVS